MNLQLPGTPYQQLLEAGIDELADQQIISRIWDHDHTVWKPDPAEITNRLGWLTTAGRMKAELPRLEGLAEEVHRAGLTKILLLGMGGSSLAPEVFSKVFNSGPVNLEVIDSTHPDYLRSVRESLSPEKTLFIVATKSGSTVETLSFFNYFYRWMSSRVGEEKAGDHFIGITDPGSKLVRLAEKYSFRDLFLNDPEIGGRYSVLSFFGLVPASLLGIDVRGLLDQAEQMAAQCRMDPARGSNPGAALGNALGILAANGRDKVTFFSSPELASFPNWVEQLIAESTGKDGKGILPVVGEPPGPVSSYSNDRLFVSLNLSGQHSFDSTLDALEKAGHPVIRIHLDQKSQLGGQFFLWEMGTAVAGYHLGINPFDQPNVESAKKKAQKMVEVYQQQHQLPAGKINLPDARLLDSVFSAQIQPGSYLAVQAYLPPGEKMQTALHKFQGLLRDRYQLAVTIGFGPRYLHSTGQLHKGDSGQGIFLQLVSQPESDLDIPESAIQTSSSISFGTLIRAQALGDAQALEEGGRSVLIFDLGQDPLAALTKLTTEIRSL
ncbi:MAG: hypothetical protein U5K99_09490 [Anaerolineales bacterium]|nr:hypothetical protein [Anaerolineales bacterium]